jgi:hypothetical protein
MRSCPGYQSDSTITLTTIVIISASCSKSAKPHSQPRVAAHESISQASKTYISRSDAENQTEDDITANALILDPESLRLQGANSDGESGDEVEEDQSGVGVVDSFDGSPKLEHC